MDRSEESTSYSPFDITIKTGTQIKMADSFKMELTRDFTSDDINEIGTDDTSCDEFKVNKVSKVKNGIIIIRGKVNNYRKCGYSNN